MRVLLFLLSLLGGAVAIATGLLVPAHLRAVDPFVLRQMASGRTVVDCAIEEASLNPPVAKMLIFAAEELKLADAESALDKLRESRGKPRTNHVLAQLEIEKMGRAGAQEVPILTALRPAAARQRLVSSLQSTGARQILENRNITNTALFAPARSAGGFPLEAAILTTAFLVEQRSFDSNLLAQVERLSANGPLPDLEEFYIDMLALSKRFSSAQLMALVAHLPTIEGLDVLTRGFQNHIESTALLFSAVVVSGNGGGIANYLREFPETAIADLSVALSLGSNPLNHLLSSSQPIFRSIVYDEFAGDARLQGVFNPLVNLATHVPIVALLLKFLLLATGAFLLVCATKFRQTARDPHYVLFNQFNLVRRLAAAVVVLMLLVIIGEPYLAQGGAELPEPPRITFSLAAISAPPTPQTSSVMLDQHTILAILTFLLLQGLIYTICLVKLAEIRKQPVSSALKLKLLDNEENLFDGGLYCGLFGTAASLILLTVGMIKPSLISAYSSTLFGILFVALVKIIHVRPYKRRLILETSELQTA